MENSRIYLGLALTPSVVKLAFISLIPILVSDNFTPLE